MSRAMVLLGLLMALANSNDLHAQDVRPESYDDLLARLDAVESELAAQHNAPKYGNSSRSCCNSTIRRAVRGGLYASYENVVIHPYFSHNGAYEIFDAIPNIPEDSETVEFDWDFEYTPRIEFGYIRPCSGLGWRARYWHFDHGTSAQATDPGTGRIEVGLHDDPDIEISTSNDEFVQATHNLKLSVLDLEAMRRRNHSIGELTVSGGLRYVRMDQDYRAAFTNINTGILDDLATSSHYFEGLGPTLALEGVRRLGRPNWSLFSKFRGSLLFGDSGLEQSSIDPQNVSSPIRDYVTASNSLDVLFIGEAQLGMGYTRCLGNGMQIFGSFAGEVQYWPSGGSGAYQNGEDSDGIGHDPRDSDMGFFGLTFAIGTSW